MGARDAQKEVAFVRGLGVDFRLGHAVNAPVARQLLEEYDAVFLGVGLGSDRRIGIPGEDGPGVLGATQWIERMKTDPTFHLPGEIQKAVVVGGGNTALDAVRELARLGVTSVTMIYRRSEKEMPGYAHEREGAQTDGVRFLFERIPVALHRDGDRLTSMTLSWAEHGKPVPGTQHDIPVDLVLVAIGQERLSEIASWFPGVEVKDGHFSGDPATGLTGNPKVYAGGDAFNGGKEVVNAVEEGKLAAQAMLRSFGLDVTLESPSRTAAPYETTSSAWHGV
jgi:glutamate synthase (NADPH/NADH) small chain